jgi:putative ABC transport system permease protein
VAVLGFIIAQLRGRPRRALALLAGVLAATTGFTVLSGAATTSQVRTVGTVEANYRAAYDVLVRPKGNRTGLEDAGGLVRPNYLSGIYGGISMAQLASVRAVNNVELAAPIAILGHSYATIEQEVDLTDQIDPNARQQVFRLTPTWIADRGLTVIDDAPKYVYLSRNLLYPQRVIVGVQPEGVPYTDGTTLPAYPFPECHFTALEVSPDGGKHQLCVEQQVPEADGTTPVERTDLAIWQIGSDGQFTDVLGLPPKPAQRLVARVNWKVLAPVAAIDPEAEAGLVGLKDAVVSGRYLESGDTPAVRDSAEQVEGYDQRYTSVPALFANRSYVDEQVQVTVERMGPAAPAALAGRPITEWQPALAAAPATPAGPPRRSTGEPSFGPNGADLGLLYQSGPPTYAQDGSGRQRPAPVPVAADQWKVTTAEGDQYAVRPPAYALDVGFRPLNPPTLGRFGAGAYPRAEAVGEFDPTRLREFSPLSRVPMETFRAPDVAGGDERSRRLLGDAPLLPSSNPTGYLSAPPLVLINLAALDRIPRSGGTQAAPLSAIRVRVAGLTGMDPLSQERVRVVAGDIAAATGLDVDITIGSSPAPQTIDLPAGKYGRPELALAENWSRKGVAVAIVAAADRKSLVLFGLILLVCMLFLANAVAAAVRDRRRELGVLACLGWPAGRLALVITGEVALVGLIAGVLAACLAVPLAHAAGVVISGWRALLAIPVGLGLALLASVGPALSAARSRPGAALTPAVLPVGRGRHARGLLPLALSNLRRVPGRTLLGVLALTVGVCALTMLLVVALAFRNDVVGTLLGDAVAIRVRSVDVFAAGVTALLGIVAVADVLYINIRERAGEFAALWAGGWSDRSLVRLVAYEGLGIGALGALLGATVGLFGIARFVGQVSPAMIRTAGLTALAATLLAGLAAAVPALILRRMPLATLLAEE